MWTAARHGISSTTDCRSISTATTGYMDGATRKSKEVTETCTSICLLAATNPLLLSPPPSPQLSPSCLPELELQSHELSRFGNISNCKSIYVGYDNQYACQSWSCSRTTLWTFALWRRHLSLMADHSGTESRTKTKSPRLKQKALCHNCFAASHDCVCIDMSMGVAANTSV